MSENGESAKEKVKKKDQPVAQSLFQYGFKQAFNESRVWINKHPNI